MTPDKNLCLNFVEQWIEQGPRQEGIKNLENFVEKALTKVSSTQLRRFFNKIKRLETKSILNKETQNDFYMLLPELAYALGKISPKAEHEKKAMEQLKKLMEKAHDCLSKKMENRSDGDKEKQEEEIKKCFKNFVRLMEATLAYHKLKLSKEEEERAKEKEKKAKEEEEKAKNKFNKNNQNTKS